MATQSISEAMGMKGRFEEGKQRYGGLRGVAVMAGYLGGAGGSFDGVVADSLFLMPAGYFTRVATVFTWVVPFLYVLLVVLSQWSPAEWPQYEQPVVGYSTLATYMVVLPLMYKFSTWDTSFFPRTWAAPFSVRASSFVVTWVLCFSRGVLVVGAPSFTGAVAAQLYSALWVLSTYTFGFQLYTYLVYLTYRAGGLEAVSVATVLVTVVGFLWGDVVALISVVAFRLIRCGRFSWYYSTRETRFVRKTATMELCEALSARTGIRLTKAWSLLIDAGFLEFIVTGVATQQLKVLAQNGDMAISLSVTSRGALMGQSAAEVQNERSKIGSHETMQGYYYSRLSDILPGLLGRSKSVHDTLVESMLGAVVLAHGSIVAVDGFVRTELIRGVGVRPPL